MLQEPLQKDETEVSLNSWQRVLSRSAMIAAMFFALHAAAEDVKWTDLSDVELNIEAPDDALVYQEPISVEDAESLVLDAIVEIGYQDEQGRYVVDLLERDKAYLGVRVTTPEGRPVVGAMPNISIDGNSRLLLAELTTAEDGVMNFGVIGGQMGLDKVTASVGETSVEFAINVISLRAAGFPTLDVLEDGIGWDELLQARLEYKDMGYVATFPDSIKSRAGETVKISGFMMPLQPDLKQKHFLLTSNPPSCFFHVPGGPAGSVEVVAAEGVEVSWNPVVLEGRFEPQETSDIGVVYRLLDAREVKP